MTRSTIYITELLVVLIPSILLLLLLLVLPHVLEAPSPHVAEPMLHASRVTVNLANEHGFVKWGWKEVQPQSELCRARLVRRAQEAGLQATLSLQVLDAVSAIWHE